MTSRRERYLQALEIAERHGNRFMAANIRAELRKLDAKPNYPAKPDSSTL
ncbi:hypothetical protein CPKG_00015 [Cyanophage KBS-S-2A]|nr:hypothetical protein CPKG_00015 [Cyanophage KBS-S-2A]AGH57646.1 hypothetical protein CPKG_00015 [Cyanophage KBS-S-2A]